MFKKRVTPLVIAIFTFTVLSIPSIADAAWQNQSGSLPGIGGGSSAGTVLLVGGAALAIIAVGTMVYKGKSKSASAPLGGGEGFAAIDADKSGSISFGVNSRAMDEGTIPLGGITYKFQ